MAATRDEPNELPRLLKRLYRYREDQRRGGVRALCRRRRRAAIVAAFEREWPGGYLLTDSGELAFVPTPIDHQAQRLMFYGFTMPAAVLAFAPAGGVAIDIGANLGEWSVPLARAVGPAGRVLCCEPNPPIAAALAATLRINNLVQATVVEAGLSAEDGAGTLAPHAGNSGMARLDTTGGIAVRLCRLDTLVAEQALARVDLVKIDVEGHERAVLEGGTDTLRRFRPALVFESGHENQSDRAAIAALFAGLDYELVAVLHDYGALACDLDAYRAARGPCAGTEARNILALPAGAATRP
jgi:FkbM family methyltransferase